MAASSSRTDDGPDVGPRADGFAGVEGVRAFDGPGCGGGSMGSMKVLSAGRGDPAVGLVSPLGTRTPAPQLLHRIFLPARSGFVANFRPHDGQANLNVAAGSTASPTGSLGAGTVRVIPHPPHPILCPA